MTKPQVTFTVHVLPSGAAYWALRLGGRAGVQHLALRGTLPAGEVDDGMTPAQVLMRAAQAAVAAG